MKKNKLYTANKWNQPVFMSNDKNIFWPGGVVATGNNNAFMQRAHNDLSNSIQGSFNPNAMPNISVPTNQGVNAQSQQQIQPQQAGLMDSSLSFLASPYGAMANGIGTVAGKALSGNKKSIFSGWTDGLAKATQGIPVVGGFMAMADGVMNALYGEEQADLDMGKINDIAAKNQQAAQGATTISNTMDYKSFADAINNVNYASTSTRGSDIDNNDTAEGRRIARELNEKAQAANDLIAYNIDFASNNIARNMSNNAAKNFVYALGGSLNGNKKGNKMNKFGLGGEEENIPQFMRYAGLITPSQIGLIPSPSYPTYSANNYEDDYLKTKMLSEKAKRPSAHPLLDRDYNSSSQLGDDLKQATLENEENIRKVAEFNRATDSLNPAGSSKMGQPPFALGGDTENNISKTLRYAGLITPSMAGLISPPSYPKQVSDTTTDTGDYLKTLMLSEEQKRAGNPLNYNSPLLANDYKKQAVLENEKQKRKVSNFNRETNDMNSQFSETGPFFAFGGDLQTHGGDYPTGLIHISAGKSHEENPYDGVQMGVDNEGTPNLVEEGETVWNDYVFSNRIEVPEEAQKWLGVKGKDLTFAEASKQLEKEIKERPNDPVSRSGFEAQMERLEEEQEFVKRCDSYSIGEIYDVDDNELALLNHNGYEYRKLG